VAAVLVGDADVWVCGGARVLVGVPLARRSGDAERGAVLGGKARFVCVRDGVDLVRPLATAPFLIVGAVLARGLRRDLGRARARGRCRRARSSRCLFLVKAPACGGVSARGADLVVHLAGFASRAVRKRRAARLVGFRAALFGALVDARRVEDVLVEAGAFAVNALRIRDRRVVITDGRALVSRCRFLFEAPAAAKFCHFDAARFMGGRGGAEIDPGHE